MVTHRTDQQIIFKQGKLQMFQKFIYFNTSNTPTPGRVSTALLAPGIFLICLGVSIFMAPQLLALFVASTFIGFGIILVVAGIRAKTLVGKSQDSYWEVD
jgi:uncharacterized membrane protein HdeD (DUF308 family)